MSDVPSEIHREILLRLPATSLFRFRTVCKSWLRIIDDPSFVRSHTTNNHRSSPNLLIRTSTGTFCSFSLDSLNFVNGEQTIHATHVKNLTRRGVPRIASLPVASCNGLILISHFEKNKIWAIWNPLTGDFREIPRPNGRLPQLSCFGIGYDSNSDDYKVVRIDRSFYHYETVYQTLVYSLKSNSWEKIENCPGDFLLTLNKQGVFLNGALHWVSRGMLVALYLATMEYRLLPLPPTNSVLNVRLDSFDGCLVMSDDYAMWRSWVMRDYESEYPIWVDLFSSDERSVIGGSSGCLWPLAYSDSEKQFIVQHDNRIMRWDIKKGSVKRVTIDGLSCSVTSQVIPGSLFRLSAAAGVKRKRRNREKFTATTIDSGRLSDSDNYSSDNDNDYY